MKKLLINASFPDEMRIALLDGNRLQSLEVESYDSKAQQNSVYKGQVTNVASGIDAAFVDFGGERNGFLPLRNIADEFKTRGGGENGQETIENLLQAGDELIVQMQVDRGQHENKGALLTTIIDLAGQYLILHPNAPQLRRTQRKIPRRSQEALQQKLRQLELPAGMGVTLGQESLDAELQTLQNEAQLLAGVWEQIQDKAREARGPALLMREPQGLFRALRDYLNSEVREVLIDTPQAFRMASEWAARNKPEQEHKIIFYDESAPLFIQHKIEARVESIHQRKVALPSGGSLIFDHTAAMTTIDINSGSLRGDDMEDTAFRANQEAAREIAQQLRFRDIGGQIVIDFIDMEQEKNRKEIEQLFRREMAQDNAHPNIGVISDFGLMCMTRKRLRPSADDTFMRVCPACNGQGKIRTTRSLAMSILRYIEFEASKQGVTDIHVLTPIDEELSSVLFNEKRRNLSAIEEEYLVNIAIIPSALLRFPNYKLQSYREQPADQEKRPEKQAAREELRRYRKGARQLAREQEDEALVSHPYQTGARPAEPKKSGWMRRLWEGLTRSPEKKTAPEKRSSSQRRSGRDDSGRQGGRRKPPQSQRRSEQKQPQRKRDGRQSREQRASDRRARPRKTSEARTGAQGAPAPAPEEAERRRPAQKMNGQERARPPAETRPGRPPAASRRAAESREESSAAPETAPDRRRPPEPESGSRPSEPGAPAPRERQGRGRSRRPAPQAGPGRDESRQAPEAQTGADAPESAPPSPSSPPSRRTAEPRDRTPGPQRPRPPEPGAPAPEARPARDEARRAPEPRTGTDAPKSAPPSSSSPPSPSSPPSRRTAKPRDGTPGPQRPRPPEPGAPAPEARSARDKTRRAPPEAQTGADAPKSASPSSSSPPSPPSRRTAKPRDGTPGPQRPRPPEPGAAASNARPARNKTRQAPESQTGADAPKSAPPSPRKKAEPQSAAPRAPRSRRPRPPEPPSESQP